MSDQGPLRDGAVGLMIGTDLALRSSAMALLFFAGALQAGAPIAVTVFIMAALLTTAFGLWRLGMPVGFSIIQSEPLAVLLPGAAIITAAGLPAGQASATAFAYLGLSAILTGAVFILVARLKFARFVRVIPYPVVVGFLGATGMLLIDAAVRDVAPSLFNRGAEGISGIEVAVLILSVSVAAFIAIAKRMSPERGMIVALLVTPLVFYLLLATGVLTVQGARDYGLLPILSGDQGNILEHVGFWAHVDWATVWQALPLMLAATTVALLALVITLGAVEAMSRSDISAEKVLMGKGAQNVVMGAFGSAPSFVSIASVGIATSGGRVGAFAGVGACAVLGLAAVNAELVVAWAPRFLTAGLLIYVGFSILWDWFLGQYARLGRSDWLLALVIILVTLVFGILVAVVVGIVIAILVFVVQYARLPIIRSVSTLETRRSAVDRSPAEQAHLAIHAAGVSIISVQGYLFFGSMDRLLSGLRALLDETDRPRLIILDLKRVSGVDGAAVEVFAKLDFIAERQGASISVAGLSKDVLDKFVAAQLPENCPNTHFSTDSVDFAIELAEQKLLDSLTPTEIEKENSAENTLRSYFEDGPSVERLLGRLRRVEVPAGTRLITREDDSRDIYLIDSGRLSVFAPGKNNEAIRIRAFRPGSFVGEISSFIGGRRSADVIADEDSVVYVITIQFLQDLAKSDPALAALWYRMMASTLAERVDRTNRLLAEFLD